MLFPYPFRVTVPTLYARRHLNGNCRPLRATSIFTTATCFFNIRAALNRHPCKRRMTPCGVLPHHAADARQEQPKSIRSNRFWQRRQHSPSPPACALRRGRIKAGGMGREGGAEGIIDDMTAKLTQVVVSRTPSLSPRRGKGIKKEVAPRF
jgi:hypothetical protein